MEESAIQRFFLEKFPQLIGFYEKEKQILGNKQITLYLFFSYVIEPALDEAFSTEDSRFISALFAVVDQLIGECNGIEDILICTIFEAYEEEIKKRKDKINMGEKMNQIWSQYCENL